MNKSFIILLFISIIVYGKHFSIEAQIKNNQFIAGGISWQSPKKFQDNDEFKTAFSIAKAQYHQKCNIATNIKWKTLEKVGIQIVAGKMWWFQAKLSDASIHKFGVYQNLDNQYELDRCQ